jgi:hypothetical protein
MNIKWTASEERWNAIIFPREYEKVLKLLTKYENE